LALVTLGVRYSLSAFFRLLVLWLLKHVVSINFVLAYLLALKVLFTSCNTWDVHHASEEWGFLLIDAHNAFNELNWTTMLWVV